MRREERRKSANFLSEDNGGKLLSFSCAVVSVWNFSWFHSETKPITWGQWSRKTIVLNWVLNSRGGGRVFYQTPILLPELMFHLGQVIPAWDHISGLGFLWKQLALEQFNSKAGPLCTEVPLILSHMRHELKAPRLKRWMRPDFSWSAVPPLLLFCSSGTRIRSSLSPLVTSLTLRTSSHGHVSNWVCDLWRGYVYIGKGHLISDTSNPGAKKVAQQFWIKVSFVNKKEIAL